MQEFVKVANVNEIPLGSSKVVTIDNKEIAIFNINNKFYAIDHLCPHKRGPLGDGWLNEKIVTCPWHQWSFDLDTGISTDKVYKAKVFQVKLEDDSVFIGPEKE
mgnify:CR=1 FL=1